MVIVMNRLSCQVSNCNNWDSGLCCLNKIKVDGPSASVSSGTCCASFSERNQDASNSNTLFSNSAEPETNIGCKAETCVHNKHCKCTANNVNVGCCCSSPKSMSETECCTFRPC